MALPILPNRPPTMTPEDYLRLQPTHVCGSCGVKGMAGTKIDPNNGGAYLYCGSCGATKQKCWPGAPAYLKQNNKTKRPDYQLSVGEVWEQGGNRCIVCGQPSEIIRRLGFGRQRHHADPFVTDGHDGLVLPICTNCHPVVSALQASMRILVKFLDDNDPGTLAKK